MNIMETFRRAVSRVRPTYNQQNNTATRKAHWLEPNRNRRCVVALFFVFRAFPHILHTFWAFTSSFPFSRPRFKTLRRHFADLFANRNELIDVFLFLQFLSFFWMSSFFCCCCCCCWPPQIFTFQPGFGPIYLQVFITNRRRTLVQTNARCLRGLGIFCCEKLGILLQSALFTKPEKFSPVRFRCVSHKIDMKCAGIEAEPSTPQSVCLQIEGVACHGVGVVECTFGSIHNFTLGEVIR